MSWNYSAQSNIGEFIQNVSKEEQAPEKKRSFGERMKEQRAAMSDLCSRVFLEIWGNEQAYKKFLDIWERFTLSPVEGSHGAGVRNAALIYNQCPEAVFLQTFAEYGEKNARIQKDSLAVDIFLPQTVERDGKATTYYNPVKVFDVSQTNAKIPLPERPVLEELQVIQAIANTELFAIDITENLPDGLDAAYIPNINSAWVRDGLNAADTTVALLTEFGHYQLSQAKDYIRNPESVFVACSTAYVLAKHYGLDTKEMNFPAEAFPPLHEAGAIKEILSTVASVSKKVALKIDKELGAIDLSQDMDHEVSR